MRVFVTLNVLGAHTIGTYENMADAHAITIATYEHVSKATLILITEKETTRLRTGNESVNVIGNLDTILTATEKVVHIDIVTHADTDILAMNTIITTITQGRMLDSITTTIINTTKAYPNKYLEDQRDIRLFLRQWSCTNAPRDDMTFMNLLGRVHLLWGIRLFRHTLRRVGGLEHLVLQFPKADKSHSHIHPCKHTCPHQPCTQIRTCSIIHDTLHTGTDTLTLTRILILTPIHIRNRNPVLRTHLAPRLKRVRLRLRIIRGFIVISV